VTTTHRHYSRRRLDVSSLILLLVSLATGIGAYLLVLQGMNPLVLVPSVVGATVGVVRLIKLEAPRD
jgi:hypothetical protein